MKQFFNKQEFQEFKNRFSIKEKPSKIEQDYFKRTYKYIKCIKWIPGIRMIGIGNSISMNCSTKDSDIDLYIVTSENRMWLVRILTTLIFQVLGVRKTDKKHANMFCLSFFSTTKAMNFSDFKIDNDIYLYFWIVYFKPLLSYNKTYQNFIEENKSWADFSNYNKQLEQNKSFIKFEENFKEKNSLILDKIDNVLKNIFIKKTLNHYEKIGKPYGIIINDNMLKFHNGDIRKQIKKELLK